MTDNRSRSRESRRAAARSRHQAESRNRWLLPVGIAGVLVVALAGAFLLSQGDGGSSPVPSGAPGGSSAGQPPVITGEALPAYVADAADAAIGRPIPAVSSASGGISATDGTAKILLFLAHWCVHCQNEVPVVQDWIDRGGLPADIDLISVSTSIDASRPNYPPGDWLAREGWTAPTIVDPQNTVAQAYGLTAFPFFVFVHADGTVAFRVTGELSINNLEAIVAGLRR
jgi:hypothetical protein